MSEEEIEQLNSTFWKQVVDSDIDGECWFFRNEPDKYHAVRVGNRTEMAHRVAFELTVGTLPSGADMDHLCRHPGCVRPEHLDICNRSMNIARAYQHAFKHRNIKPIWLTDPFWKSNWRKPHRERWS